MEKKVLKKGRRFALYTALFAAALVIFIISGAKAASANPETGKVGLANCRVYAAESMTVKSEPGSGTILCSVTAGKRMTLISQVVKGNTYYWEVTFTQYGWTYTGYVERSRCLINIGDYDPNIQVNITNATGSLLKTQKYSSSNGYYSYVALSDVTGESIYGSDWQSDEAPVTYAFARRLSAANTAAMKDGYVLRIYDSYRPYFVTQLMSTALKDAYNSYSEVRSNITRYGFSVSWFVSVGTSAHNTGTAVDVTLVDLSTGEELDMPTEMHLLSSAAAIASNDSSSSSYLSGSYTRKSIGSIGVGAGTAAQKANAVRLNNYMTGAALYSLKSEWWHFQFYTSSGGTAYNWTISD